MLVCEYVCCKITLFHKNVTTMKYFLLSGLKKY